MFEREEAERDSVIVEGAVRAIGGIAASSRIEKIPLKWSPMNEATVYQMLGEEGFTRIVAAFYRQVPQDDILGKMYPPDDLKGAEERLRDFLIFRFGGSQRYIERRGHPRLRQRHFPFQIDCAARDRWMALMENAFEEAAIPLEARSFLRDFLGQVATFLMNSEDPAA